MKIILLKSMGCFLFFLGLCPFITLEIVAETNSFDWRDASTGKHHFSFIIENDQFNGTDDYHTHSFRLNYIFPAGVPKLALRVSHETLTQRDNGTRTDLLNFGVSLGRQYWKGGTVSYYAGGIINGDLGGQCFQNTLHRWLEESEVHLDYPSSYSLGVSGEARLDQKLTEFSGFSIEGTGAGRLVTSARGMLFKRSHINWAPVQVTFKFLFFIHIWNQRCQIFLDR